LTYQTAGSKVDIETTSWPKERRQPMCTAVSIVLLLSVGSPPPFGPFGGPAHPVTREAASIDAESGEKTRKAGVMRGARWVYTTLARFQGPRCPHRPSCSAYALEAVSAHGMLVGSWLTVNRLYRSGHAPGHRPLQRDPEGLLRDPLDDADFWLSARRR
jgi:putative component of membrane protein insertase Oxa1/YidC/SpoIIIJ protein YidD